MAPLTNYVKSRGTFISRHVRTACHLTNEKILDALHVKEHTILRKILNVTQKILLKMFWLMSTIASQYSKNLKPQRHLSCSLSLLKMLVNKENCRALTLFQKQSPTTIAYSLLFIFAFPISFPEPLLQAPSTMTALPQNQALVPLLKIYQFIPFGELHRQCSL